MLKYYINLDERGEFFADVRLKIHPIFSTDEILDKICCAECQEIIE